jgi:hypothetical protein
MAFLQVTHGRDPIGPYECGQPIFTPIANRKNVDAESYLPRRAQILIAAGIAWLRRDPLPAPLAIALATCSTALGFGGLNEMVEFIATLARSGAHTGGYWNTGWDLICNFIGAGTAGLIIARLPPPLP